MLNRYKNRLNELNYKKQLCKNYEKELDKTIQLINYTNKIINTYKVICKNDRLILNKIKKRHFHHINTYRFLEKKIDNLNYQCS